MNSKFLSLGMNDLSKGIVVSIGASVLTAIVPMLQSGQVPNIAQLKQIGLSGVAAGIAYLVKNLFTNSKNQMGTPE
jgi:hypothetical protein